MTERYTDQECRAMLEWLIENEAFVCKDAHGLYGTLIVQQYDGHEKSGDVCDNPLDAIKSAMDSTLIIQVSKDK